MVGLLARNDLELGMAELGPGARVMQVMRRDFSAMSPEEPAERGFALLARGAPVVPVVYFGRLVGLLTPENLSEFLWLRQAAQDDRFRAGDRRPTRAGV
jgi:hypothetical protein